MSRYGEPTGWRYYREWVICIGLAVWEEILAWVGLVVIFGRDLGLRLSDRARRRP